MTTAKPKRGSHGAAASLVTLLSLSLIIIFPQSLFAFIPSVDPVRGARRRVWSGRRGPTSSLDLLDDIIDDDDDEEEEEEGYPVRIHHRGHDGTIFVRRDETILHALERQSISPPIPRKSRRRRIRGNDDATANTGGSLALSHVPHDCRRGTCLTCSSRFMEGGDYRHVVPNVNNGLARSISSLLDESGIVLTCCSYVTGPGVVLELDVNDDTWDMVYRRRTFDEPDTKSLGMEARARLLRRIDEGDVNGWRRRMEETLESR